MASLGAEVYGIESDAQQSSAAMSTGYLKSSNVFQGKLQDMPKHPDGKFDLATVFNWKIPNAEQDKFIKALSQAIKPGGQAVIHLDNHHLSQSAAIQSLAKEHFAQVNVAPASYLGINHQLLVLAAPKQQKKPLSTRLRTSSSVSWLRS
jgi:2-polyprenyl-3-methyl-5-hydroxy-6-metoxy-1,4-benzoquinol methylase